MNPHISSVPMNYTFTSKTSRFYDENTNGAAQHMTPLDEVDSNDNDIDWESIISEDEYNIDELCDDIIKTQSDESFSSDSECKASTTSNSFSTSFEEEEAKPSRSRTHTTLEIAVLLSLFRHRHSLSKYCLTDICHLLRLLGIKMYQMIIDLYTN